MQADQSKAGHDPNALEKLIQEGKRIASMKAPIKSILKPSKLVREESEETEPDFGR